VRWASSGCLKGWRRNGEADARHHLRRHGSFSRRGFRQREVQQCGVEGDVALCYAADSAGAGNAYSRERGRSLGRRAPAIEVAQAAIQPLRLRFQTRELQERISNGEFVACRAGGDWRGLELGRLR